MKKMLRRIMVLALVATMFIMPGSTALAASNPVVYTADGFVSIQYEPDPLYLSPGTSFGLSNYADSTRYWNVPAGKQFSFTIFTSEPYTAIRVQIYKNGNLIRDNAESSSMNGYNYRFGAENVDTSYLFIITALTDIHMLGYASVTY